MREILHTRLRSECILASFHIVQYVLSIFIRDCDLFLRQEYLRSGQRIAIRGATNEAADREAGYLKILSEDHAVVANLEGQFRRLNVEFRLGAGVVRYKLVIARRQTGKYKSTAIVRSHVTKRFLGFEILSYRLSLTLLRETVLWEKKGKS